MEKQTLLNTLYANVSGALVSGQVTGRAAPVLAARGIAGPRAGAVEIDAGLMTGEACAGLRKYDAGLARQLIPWVFPGAPAVSLVERRVRVEAGWPDSLQQKSIPVKTLPAVPGGGGRWVVGLGETGETITAALSNAAPHWLIAGTSGSGKTWAVISAVVQLARDPENTFVLIDGKRGASLRDLAHLRGLVGPVACDPVEWRAALLWVAEELTRRASGGRGARLVVVVDEVQEIMGDPTAGPILSRILSMGRDSSIHALVATQHPTIKALGGDSAARNLGGRLALRVVDSAASQVALGSGCLYRADRLQGAGDCYARAGADARRVQIAYTTPGEIRNASDGSGPGLERWPDGRPESIPADLGDGGGSDRGGRPAVELSAVEIAGAIEAAAGKRGRPWLKARLLELGAAAPGNDRAARLLELGRAALAVLAREGWSIGRDDGGGGFDVPA